MLRGNALANWSLVVFGISVAYMTCVALHGAALSISINVLNNKLKKKFGHVTHCDEYIIYLSNRLVNDFPFVKQMKASTLYFHFIDRNTVFCFDHNDHNGNELKQKKKERRNLQQNKQKIKKKK